MYAICYICNKQQSTDVLHRNFTELKSQHTDTPIYEFIKTLLADFDSVRNIDDDANHICVECLSQIDEYDWMKQQTIEQEAKLRHLLLTTELKWKNIKNTPIEIEDDSHNGLVFAKELENAEIKLESSDNVEEIRVQQPPTPPPSPYPSTSISMSKDLLNVIPAFPLNGKRTFVKITKPRDAFLRIGQDVLVSTKTVSTNAKVIKSSVDADMPSSVQDDATANGTTAQEYAKPLLSYVWLVAMAFKNSHTGSLLVSEICSFLCEHFPYFKTAANDWKRSIRNTLSSNKYFIKMGLQISRTDIRTKYFWAMKPTKMDKMDVPIQKWLNNYAKNVYDAMAVPENLPALMCGEMKHGSLNKFDDIIYSDPENQSSDSVTSGKETVQFDFTGENFNVFDEVDVDDSKSFQFEQNTEHNQAESLDSHFQSMKKRARHDIDLPVLPMQISKLTDSIASKTTSQSIKFNATGLKYLRPAFSYSCLIAMALKNSRTGSLPTSEICSFICKHFPYFKTATEDWKRSIRNFLSSNECFDKMEYKTVDGVLTKKCLWTINPLKLNKINENIRKLSQFAEPNTMAVPGNLVALLRGDMKHGGLYESGSQSNGIKEFGPKFTKPILDNASLIALALKNSRTGTLLFEEIFKFICEHFPYFKTAPKVWKNSVQNNLRSNKFFFKIEQKSIVDGIFNTKCLWQMNPSKINEINARLELQLVKNETLIQNAMAAPENLPALLRGEMKHGSLNDSFTDSNGTGIDNSECEYMPFNSIIESEENTQAELFDNEFDIFDINIEDLLLFRNTPCIEDGQSQGLDGDEQAMGKRARLDID